MEADQADSPGDSSPDPEISRFFENMKLRCKGRFSVLALTPARFADTPTVSRTSVPRADQLPGWHAGAHGTVTPGIKAQLSTREERSTGIVVQGLLLLPRPRVRFTV